MTTLGADKFSAYDAAINGQGLLIAWSDADSPYQLRAGDVALERQDLSENISENKLDTLYWGVNRNWRNGSTQKRLNMPQVSSPYAFWDGYGIDITEAGELTCAPANTKVLTLTNTNQLMGFTDVALFTVRTALAGNAALKRFTALDASDATDIDLGVVGSETTIKSIGSDGSNIYVALGSLFTKKVTSAGVVSTFEGTFDNQVCLWAKDRLYCAGVKTGTTYRFFEISSSGTATEIFVLPDGWTVTAIATLGPMIYFCANKGDSSIVYAYNGTDAPFEAIPSDAVGRGITLHAMRSFSGAGLLIGGRVLGTTSGVGKGVLFRGFPAASGHLTIEERVRLGSDSASDYTIFSIFTHGKNAYFGWRDVSGQAISSARAMLGVYIPETGGAARMFNSGVDGIVRAGGVFKGRRIYSVDASGVYVEQAATYQTAVLVSSEIDINIAADKLWIAEEVMFDPLPASCTIAYEYSTDSGVTWTAVATASTTSSTRSRTAIAVKSPSIKYRVTLTPSGASKPLVRQAGIGGWPASKPKSEHTLIIDAYPATQLRNGGQQDTRDAGWNLLNTLLGYRDAATNYEYQPPWWPLSAAALTVRVAAVETFGPWGTSGVPQGGLIRLTLKEIV